MKKGFRPCIAPVAFTTLVALLLSSLAPSASADEYALKVFATNSDDRYWFEIEGHPGENPTLSFEPGDKIRFEVQNAGSQPHNLHFATPIGNGSDYLAPGRTTNLTIEVPGGIAPQRIGYWCDPHRQLGMRGELIAGSEDAAGPDSRTPQDVPAPAGILVLAAVASALHMGRRSRR